MSGPTFRPATRERRPAKVLLVGPSGSGKTLSGMYAMSTLTQRFAVAQSEPAAELYIPKMPRGIQVDTYLMERMGSDDWVAAMHAAVEQGYGGIMLDSISEEWKSTLAAVDATMNTRGAQDNREGWKQQRPRHDAFALALARLPIHVVATARSKEKLDWSSGKARSRGEEPVQDNEINFWFDLVLAMDADHTATVLKVRGFEGLDGVSEHKPDQRFLAGFAEWLASGAEPTTGELAVARLNADFPDLGDDVVRAAIREAGVKTLPQLEQPGWYEAARALLENAKAELAKKPRPG